MQLFLKKKVVCERWNQFQHSHLDHDWRPTLDSHSLPHSGFPFPILHSTFSIPHSPHSCNCIRTPPAAMQCSIVHSIQKRRVCWVCWSSVKRWTALPHTSLSHLEGFMLCWDNHGKYHLQKPFQEASVPIGVWTLCGTNVVTRPSFGRH